MTSTERAPIIFARLRLRYPKTAPALDHANAWELLVATVLAAQCTDARVNMVTPNLFARWPGLSAPPGSTTTKPRTLSARPSA
ncbi:MAG: endonuclease [Desulfovibrionaceae bacterium]|nr:MAG: endonuclease [Desulfovibrionaceae bacterium]